MPSTTVNDITLEYDVQGDGEPLLLVMGLGGQLIDWPQEFVDLFLAEGFQVIRFDNRDVGLSTQTSWTPPNRRKTLMSMVTRRPLPGVGYTLTDMAGDAAAVLDAVGLDSAHVVGASMGGMIAQELAIEHPDRVRSICSIMSNTGDRRNGGIAASLIRKLARMDAPVRETALDDSVEMFRMISGPLFDEPRFRELSAMAIERSWAPDGVTRQSAAIAGSRDRTPLLASVTVPTLVIHGLVDPLVKHSGGVATAHAIPGARLLSFPDMGHDIPQPRLDEIRDAIVLNTRRAVPVA
ncbi:MAG: alpha/beta hydrolase [Actinomycetota bacterium]